MDALPPFSPPPPLALLLRTLIQDDPWLNGGLDARPSMEAVTAIGLVCNILQVSQFAYQLVAKGHEIRSTASGLTLEQDHLSRCTSELVARNERLYAQLHAKPDDKAGKPPSAADAINKADATALRDMADSCNAAAAELINELRRLAAKSSTSTMKSLRHALKAIWGKDKVDGLASRMRLYQEQINSQILVSLSRQQSVQALSTSDQFASLNQTERQILEGVRSLPILMANKVDASTNLIAQLIRSEGTRVIEQLTKSSAVYSYIGAASDRDRSPGQDLPRYPSSPGGRTDVTMTIHQAAAACDTKAIQAILRQDAAAVKHTDDNDQTALHIVARAGSATIASHLLRKGADVNIEDNNFITPLHCAALSGDAATTRLLLAKGADPDALDINKQRPSALASKKTPELVWIFNVGYGLEDRDASGDTALIHFILALDLDAVKSLLEQGADVAAKNRDGLTALWLATEVNGSESQSSRELRLQIMASLLAHGANPSTANSDNRYDTPLSTTALRGLTDAAMLLMDAGARLDTRNSHDFTPLHEACDHRHEAIGVALVERGAPLSARNHARYQPLNAACQRGCKDIVTAILRRPEADVNCRGCNDWTPIAEASHHGHLSIVEQLLDHGADARLQVAPHDGAWPPITLAVLRGHVSIVALLITKGNAHVNQPGVLGSTALYEASSGGHSNIVLLLLEHGANTESPGDIEERTPLGEAARNGHICTARILLVEGHARLDARTAKNRDVPLMEAVKAGHAEIVTLLLDHGASMADAERDQNDALKSSLLGHASRSGSVEVTRMLIDRGADVEIRNERGFSPLHEAAQWGQVDAARVLLQAGADKDARNRYGFDALTTARHFNKNEAVQQSFADLLLELGRIQDVTKLS